MTLSSFKYPAGSILLLLLSCMTSITVSASTLESVDVVVVGAGLSGLTAARDLLKNGKSVVVLEARDRVGGKVFNQPLRNGGVTEVGAEFVGPTQDKIINPISELGLETFATYNEGNSLLWRNGTRTVYQPDPQLGGAPPVEQSAIEEVATALDQLDAWAAQTNTSTPWKHPRAKEWDDQTFEDYLTRSISHADAKLVLTTVCKAIFSAEPHELSLLYLIAYIAAAGNESTVGTLGRLMAVEGGAQEQRVKGGTGLIPERLAEKVGLKHITLNAAVSQISKTCDGYAIVSRAGTIHAKDVVLAMSPPLLR
jgi:monoamine oxidase